jgi:hypothetical protein
VKNCSRFFFPFGVTFIILLYALTLLKRAKLKFLK